MPYPGFSWEVFPVNPSQAWFWLANEIISKGMDPSHHLSNCRDSLPLLAPHAPAAGFLCLLLLPLYGMLLAFSPPVKILPRQDQPCTAHLASRTCGYTVFSDCWICCPEAMGFLKVG